MWSVNLRQKSQEYTWGKESLLNKWCWENWTTILHHVQKLTQNGFKNVRLETIKILKEKSKLPDIGLGDDFLDLTPKAKATKAKINTWNYIKLKSFYTAKETINKMKRQPMEWEKIFVNHIADKGLISKIYKELSSKEPNNPVTNGQRT